MGVRTDIHFFYRSEETKEFYISMWSTIDVDTVHSDERTISLAVIFVFIIYVRFIGIFYCPETPTSSDQGRTVDGMVTDRFA